ncbi:hypothetical protein GCM10009839_40000 [Catenulispora yoronensis]|uniref:Uncharacterized protein n=1 Tax=Catenulispora yoronensis TaxID=450799 RepID=A0ABP5G1A5_9ACTN
MTGATTLTRIAGHRRKCGCGGCRARQARYLKQRELAVLRGTWQYPVPVEGVAARLEELLQAGWTVAQVAAAARLSTECVRRLAGGPAVSRPATVRAATARALAALGPRSRLAPTVPDGMLINPVGSMRRLQALAAIGWPQAELGRRLGLATTPMSTDPSITAGRARAIVDLYRQLWDVPGPSHLAAARARGRGAVPPTAWDDDTIDDPRAMPSGAADPSAARSHGCLSREYTSGEVAFLSAAGETNENIAARLRITVKYVEKMLSAQNKARCLA